MDRLQLSSMLILPDETMPHRLRRMRSGHDVRTTAYQGWAGLTNGALLKAAVPGACCVCKLGQIARRLCGQPLDSLQAAHDLKTSTMNRQGRSFGLIL